MPERYCSFWFENELEFVLSIPIFYQEMVAQVSFSYNLQNSRLHA